MEYIVIIPALNPDPCLEDIVKKLWQWEHQIVVVDDGSEQVYRPLFDRLSEKAIVLRHKENRGKGAAIKTALEYIGKELWEGRMIGIMDADGQHLPEDMEKVLGCAASRPGTLVLGSRTMSRQVPWRSRLGNAVARKVFQAAVGGRIRDTQTGLRAFSADLLKEMQKVAGERYEYEMNVLIHCVRKGIPVEEVPVRTIYHDKDNSCSHFRGIRDSLRIFGQILKFSAASFSSFLLDYGLFALFTAALPKAAWSAAAANVGARVLSAAYNYTVNCRLVFGQKQTARTAVDYLALAAGVIRLAKMKILVQNMYSLETLAHVDTLCLDKTGTITDGRLKVCRVIPMSELPQGETENLLKAYMAACEDNNATFQALREAFPPVQGFRPVHRIPFSSKRKWGCISFRGVGSVFVGAPERLLGKIPENLERELDKGRRVIAVGYSGRMWENDQALPADIRPLYGVVLEDTIRPNAVKTLGFFRKEGVDVKIISGDHVKTVSMIAKRAGLDRWMDAADLSREGETPDYDRLCREYSVFARVTPQQKQELVKALKRQGHQVAMTGDGVNDLLALREADCSIAVADGSDASRQISQVVLLNSDFTHLPQVVMEGRRVVNNVTRTAQVFFIKTIYSILVSLFCLAANQPFPFIPIQITLVDACIEAYPSFLTILEADTGRLRGKFLPTALSHAAPFGTAVTGIILLFSLLAPFDVRQRQTVMYLLLILISMAAVVKSCIPFNGLRLFICVTMAGGTFFALAVLPSLFQVEPVTAGMAAAVLMGGAIACLLLLILEQIRRQGMRRREQRRMVKPEC